MTTTDFATDPAADGTRLPGVDDIERWCAQWAGDGIAVQQIGSSREGRPIRLVSPGGPGPLNALIVGTPHPNEPIGVQTACRLVQAVRRGDPAVAGLPFHWHVVPSIEPDGLHRNQGWLATPHDLSAYLRHFFRPSFDEQAEYTFALNTPGYRFDRPTPENLAWQAAIDRVQPDLLVSLHNAECGGAFYVLNRDWGGLAATLAAQPAKHGFVLDEQGEFMSGLPAIVPGVFTSPDLAAFAASAPGAWTAGQSSFGHCAPRGTLGLTAEVPMWQPRPAPAQAPDESMDEALRPAIAWTREAQALVDAGVPLLRGVVVGGEWRLFNAVAESQRHLAKLLAVYGQLPPVALPADAAQRQRLAARLFALRAVAMLARLADEVARRRDDPRLAEVGQAARAHLEAALGDPALRDAMVPVPLRQAVALQFEAILTAAATLAGQRPG